MRERVCAGLDRAKTDVKQLGRPTSITSDQMSEIWELRQPGKTYRGTADHFDVSVGTVQRAVNAV